MHKIAIAVAIIAGLSAAALYGYDIAKAEAYAKANNCSWHYDEAGFRGKCLTNK